MQVRLLPTPRSFHLPLWAYLLLGTWLGSLALLEYLRSSHDIPGSLCMMRRMTGFPCPTCGSTRLVRSAWEGDLLAAFAFNPMVFVVLVGGGLLLGLKVLGGRRLELRASRGEWIALWSLVVLGFLASWIHVALRDHGD